MNEPLVVAPYTGLLDMRTSRIVIWHKVGDLWRVVAKLKPSTNSWQLIKELEFNPAETMIEEMFSGATDERA